jgi:hypothetical protein
MKKRGFRGFRVSLVKVQDRLVSCKEVLPGGSIQCLVARTPRVAGQERLVSARSEAARFTRKALLVVCSFFRLRRRENSNACVTVHAKKSRSEQQLGGGAQKLSLEVFETIFNLSCVSPLNSSILYVLKARQIYSSMVNY